MEFLTQEHNQSINQSYSGTVVLGISHYVAVIWNEELFLFRWHFLVCFLVCFLSFFLFFLLFCFLFYFFVFFKPYYNNSFSQQVSASQRPISNLLRDVSAYSSSSTSSSSSYPIILPKMKNSREVFVVNFELGFFACQLNASSDFLEVYSLSRLCDGIPDCFGGTDENRDYVPCSGT